MAMADVESKIVSRVTIHKITDGNNVTITKDTDGKTRIDHDALMKVFDHPILKDKPFAIISITGLMRTGKSFLMNFILRYLCNKGWENESWMGDENYTMTTDDLAFKAGHKRCTIGIKVFSKVFEIEVENTTLMVILMDCQGLFDHETPQEVNKALLTLTTLMSSVQIFNSFKQIDSQQLDYLKTCLDFAELATEKSKDKGSKESCFQLQDLMFLIRDSKETKSTAEENFGFAPGRNYMDDFAISTGSAERLAQTQKRIQKSFKNVDCFMMPFPGSGVEKETFTGRNGDLSNDFRHFVKEFVEHIASPKRLKPKQSKTRYSTPRELRNMVASCDTIFSENMIGSENMMKMNEKAYYSSVCEEAIAQYDKLMGEKATEINCVDELRQIHKQYKKKGLSAVGESVVCWHRSMQRKIQTTLRGYLYQTFGDYRKEIITENKGADAGKRGDDK